jgi:periplasmic protein TonB
MFNELVECGVNREGTRKSWTVTVAAMGQAGILMVLVVIPLIFTEVLPKATAQLFLLAPPPPAAAPRPPAGIVTEPRHSITHVDALRSPSMIPRKIEDLKEDVTPQPMEVIGVANGTGNGENGQANGVLNGILNGVGVGNVAPPPPPVAPAQHRVRVGGQVQAAKMIRQVQPAYPSVARNARVQGTVVLHAVISKDGSVQELTYLSGPALLMRAAMDAVREWKYQPTLLNGEPVEVDTTISVIFTLGQ